MKVLRVGKHMIPLWLIAVLLISGAGIGVLADQIWRTLTIPVTIEEPLEILTYPSELSLYPGENMTFYVTVVNHASLNYSVLLGFKLSNTTYQTSYVTFSNTIYTVVSGTQNLTASMTVRPDAPSINTTLSIDFHRGVYPYGLVGYWKFDEGSGTLAYDNCGNNNHGILVNGPAWIDGKYGKALNFDGVNDYVEVPQSSSLNIVDSVTVTAWVCPKAFPDSAIILSRWYDGTEPDRGIVLQLIQGYCRFGVINDGNILDLPFSFEINKWYYLTATWNGSFSEVYVNGIEIGNRSTSGSFTNQNLNLGIGGDINPLQSQFKGTIDNVMIFNRALTAEEIQALYTNPLP